MSLLDVGITGGPGDVLAMPLDELESTFNLCLDVGSLPLALPSFREVSSGILGHSEKCDAERVWRSTGRRRGAFDNVTLS